eukprot:1158959-Pelagomonas_calceolata.AAC.10
MQACLSLTSVLPPSFGPLLLDPFCTSCCRTCPCPSFQENLQGGASLQASVMASPRAPAGFPPRSQETPLDMIVMPTSLYMPSGLGRVPGIPSQGVPPCQVPPKNGTHKMHGYAMYAYFTRTYGYGSS